MTLQDSEDLDKFLRDVDQINELVKGLSSNDVSSQDEAFKKADKFIASHEQKEQHQTKINKTFINTNPSSENRPQNVQRESSQNPENFMRMLEKDAEERGRRRKRREDEANALKEEGNKAFARGDYETAVSFYTKGLDQLRDMQTLYTNRAQAFIKLEKYKEAISDCEWALRCNEKCIKAYVHMGKSHLALKRFSEARMCYQKILEIEPQRETMIRGYLNQVDLEEKVSLQEQAAWEELREETEQARAVPELLKKLSRPKEINLYYCGGVKLLSRAIKDCAGQTLFRLNNGFHIVNGNNVVRRTLQNRSLWIYASLSSNYGGQFVLETNQRLLTECPNARECIVQMLVSPEQEVRWECLELVSMYSQTPYGRDLLICNLDLRRTSEALIGCLCQDTCSTPALTILENLAAENKFKIQSRENVVAVFALPLECALSNCVTANHETLAAFISVIGSLVLDDVIGKKMANREELWRSAVRVMEHNVGCECRTVLYPLLGLMFNLASHPSPIIQEHAVLVSRRLLDLLNDPHGGIITRAVGLLSVLLPKSHVATQEVVRNGIVRRLLKILKVAGEMSSRYSIKALAVCTASVPQACEDLVKLDKRLHTLRKLLGGVDEVVVGNAALCMGHCLGVDGAASGLLGTDCVPLLLHHAAGDAKRAAVRQNAAITLGKLCKAEPRHVVKLRELHGLEILHSCVRLIT